MAQTVQPYPPHNALYHGDKRILQPSGYVGKTSYAKMPTQMNSTLTHVVQNSYVNNPFLPAVEYSGYPSFDMQVSQGQLETMGSSRDKHLQIIPYTEETADFDNNDSASISAMPEINVDHVVDSIRSKEGIVTCSILILLCISLFLCLVRHDYNFVFYIMAYHVWFIEKQDHSIEGMLQFKNSAKHLLCAIVLSCIADIIWLFMGYSTWTCKAGNGAACFPNPIDIRLKDLYGAHRFALSLSVLALIVKIILTYTCVSIFKKKKECEDGNTSE